MEEEAQVDFRRVDPVLFDSPQRVLPPGEELLPPLRLVPLHVEGNATENRKEVLLAVFPQCTGRSMSSSTSSTSVRSRATIGPSPLEDLKGALQGPK